MDLTNRICCILLHGKSLEELEKRIEQFSNLDLIWGGINYFCPSEKILKKINKDFDIIFDSSTLPLNINLEYETNFRIPRLSEFLDRPKNNIYVCNKTGHDNLYDFRKKYFPNFNEKYKNKIIYSEDLGINSISFDVSLSLYIACLLKFNPKRIVLFGADGGGSIESYFEYDLVKIDKKNNGDLGKEHQTLGDTNNVNTNFNRLMQENIGSVPEIINCSFETKYEVFKKISYDEVLNYLNK